MIQDFCNAPKEVAEVTFTLSKILELRKDTSKVYFAFIEYFVSGVVGKNVYKKNKCDKLLSQFTSVSNEALAILIFENNVDTWNDMAQNKITKNSNVYQKYTNGGSSKAAVGSSRRYHGWSTDGLKRFNELFDIVKTDRLSPNAKVFEESFRAFCINGGMSGKTKKPSKPLCEYIEVRHELWDESEHHGASKIAANTMLNLQQVQCRKQDIMDIEEDEEEEDINNKNNDLEEDEDPHPYNTQSKNMTVRSAAV